MARPFFISGVGACRPASAPSGIGPSDAAATSAPLEVWLALTPAAPLEVAAAAEVPDSPVVAVDVSAAGTVSVTVSVLPGAVTVSVTGWVVVTVSVTGGAVTVDVSVTAGAVSVFVTVSVLVAVSVTGGAVVVSVAVTVSVTGWVAVTVSVTGGAVVVSMAVTCAVFVTVAVSVTVAVFVTVAVAVTVVGGAGGIAQSLSKIASPSGQFSEYSTPLYVNGGMMSPQPGFLSMPECQTSPTCPRWPSNAPAASTVIKLYGFTCELVEWHSVTESLSAFGSADAVAPTA